MKDTLTRLRKAFKTADLFEVGTVIRFESVAYDGLRTYDYAAIFAGNKRWYLTGSGGIFGQGLTSAELVEALTNANVVNIELAAEWELVKE